MIELDRIHLLLNKQLDEGASFAQIKCYSVLFQRQLKWSHGRSSRLLARPYQSWTLCTLNRGIWSIQNVHNFLELERYGTRSIQLSNELSQSSYFSKSHKDLMISKPIRQVLFQEDPNFQPPPPEEVLLQMEQIQKVFEDALHFNYRDQLIQYHYWDSEHTRGGTQYINIALNLHQTTNQPDVPAFNIDLHHTATPQQPLEFKELQWHRDVKRFARAINEPIFRGPSPEDMLWIFSARAFAKLIQGTLGPTLCLEKPDPFNENMNPASLIETQLTSSVLTLYSSPELFGDKTLLDEEGVPARRLLLIDKGILRNFVLTRFSAHHLSRSLPIHKEKILAGSARSNSYNHFHHADLRHIEISPGQTLEKDFRLSHLYIPDVEIDQINASGESFTITAKNCLVNKFGGMHKRHVPRLRLNVDRQTLWTNLLGCGQEQKLIYLPSLSSTKHQESLGCFLAPMAKFRGLPCTWS